MTTQPYSDLYALIEAKCGVQFAPIEQPRVKAWVNSRAQQAFDACDYWPRWVTPATEERVVTGSLIPFVETGSTTIGSFVRIFMANPYGQDSTQEFDYYVSLDGAHIINGDLDTTSAFVTYMPEFTANYGDGNQGENTSIPQEWFQYIAHGTYSDFLSGDGQQEKSLIEDQKALALLDVQLCKPEIVRTMQMLGNKVSTNANMQTRYIGGGYPV